MPGFVLARWSCSSCGGKGSASGPWTDTRERPDDPIRINCFDCFQTVVLDPRPGLHPLFVRVEGEHAALRGGCPRCHGDVQTFWDGIGTPLAACPRCDSVERLAEPAADPTAWEVLYDLHGERFERRRGDRGWEFKARFSFPAAGRLARRPADIVIEAFEPDASRPLRDVFAEIRAERRRIEAEVEAQRARARPRGRAPQAQRH